MGNAFKVKDGLTTAWRPTGGAIPPPKGILAPKMIASPGFVKRITNNDVHLEVITLLLGQVSQNHHSFGVKMLAKIIRRGISGGDHDHPRLLSS